jgi:hypothetical protein
VDSQVALDNYLLIRADDSTNKIMGGGLALYTHKDWCDSFNIISKHSTPNLERMAVNLRPFWTPREIASIIVIMIYATIFEATPTYVSKETTNQIHQKKDAIEKLHPNSTVIALGDFNHVNLKLPGYYQQVSCTTRLNKTLHKCYLKHRNAYKTYKLPELGNSDHNPVLLIPKYKAMSLLDTSKQNVFVRVWSDSSQDKLLCALETTEWDTLTKHCGNQRKRILSLTICCSA